MGNLMSSKSKQKGSAFEHEVVQQAVAQGVYAKRAWGSNGASLGCHEEVDVLLGTFRVQCKRRAKLSAVARPSEHVDIQLIREDRGDTFAILPYSLLLKLLNPDHETQVTELPSR